MSSSEGSQMGEELAPGLRELYEEFDSDSQEQQDGEGMESQNEDYDDQEEESAELDSDIQQNESLDQEQENQSDSEEDNENYQAEDQYNEVVRKLNGKTLNFSKFKAISKNLIKQQEKNDSYQQFLETKQTCNSNDNEYLKNDEEQLGVYLKDLQKSLLENNDSYQKQYKLLRKTNSSLQVEEGIGFLNAKSLLFQEYMINLHIYMLYKVQGKPLDQEFVKKMLYQKVLLQKMKPVEKKLEYQIQKLLKMSFKKKPEQKSFNPYADNDDNDDIQDQDEKSTKNGKSKKGKEIVQNLEQDQDLEEDPDNFKPNPNNLIDSDDDSQDEKQKKNQDKSKQKYVAPKLVSALPKQEQLAQKREKQNERRKVHLRKQLADSLLDPSTDIQKEISYGQGGQKAVSKSMREREMYEMQNFVRLPVTKKDKFIQKQFQKKNNQGQERLDDFTEQKQIRELLSYENIIDKKEAKFGSSNNNQNNKRKFNNGFSGKKAKGGKQQKGKKKIRF